MNLYYRLSELERRLGVRVERIITGSKPGLLVIFIGTVPFTYNVEFGSLILSISQAWPMETSRLRVERLLFKTKESSQSDLTLESCQQCSCDILNEFL